jgi:hypothetical protein
MSGAMADGMGMSSALFSQEAASLAAEKADEGIADGMNNNSEGDKSEEGSARSGSSGSSGDAWRGESEPLDNWDTNNTETAISEDADGQIGSDRQPLADAPAPPPEQAEQADQQRLADEQRQQAEQADQQRLADEQRQQAEQADQQRLADEQRQQAEQADQQRLADEQRQQAEQADQQRLADEQRKQAEQADPKRGDSPGSTPTEDPNYHDTPVGKDGVNSGGPLLPEDHNRGPFARTEFANSADETTGVFPRGYQPSRDVDHDTSYEHIDNVPVTHFGKDPGKPHNLSSNWVTPDPEARAMSAEEAVNKYGLFSTPDKATDATFSGRVRTSVAAANSKGDGGGTQWELQTGSLSNRKTRDL